MLKTGERLHQQEILFEWHLNGSGVQQFCIGTD